MNSNKEKLVEVFRRAFPSIKEDEDILSASMESLREWDSLSHINLMLFLDEVFGLKNLSADDYIKLTTFKNILELVESSEG